MAAAAPPLQRDLPRLPAMPPRPVPPLDRPWWRDWTQWVAPGPRRVFSAQELGLAGQQPWPGGVDSFLYINVLILLATLVPSVPTPAALLMFPLGLALAWGVLLVSRWLWRVPTRRRLTQASYGAGLLLIAGMLLALRLQLAEREPLRTALLIALALYLLVLSSWLMLCFLRVQQIEGRLRELADQQQQLALTRRLATAQIHPHFLFNTLASLTHWVQTHDARAAPLLNDLAAYLRATLPMFEREAQPLAEEWALVRHYLGIMQARLGERLQWTITHDPALDGLLVPPGSLLTLAENAITHGIEPTLRGGALRLVSERLPDGRARLTVEDEGAGLPQPYKPGLGLSNTRDRLLQLHPGRATLTLTPLHPDGRGCRAEVLLLPPL